MTGGSRYFKFILLWGTITWFLTVPTTSDRGVVPLAFVPPCTRTINQIQHSRTAFRIALVTRAVATTPAEPMAPSILKPVLDVPLHRLKLPFGAMGKENTGIDVKIHGLGPFRFMVDTGLTTVLVTPDLEKKLLMAMEKDMAVSEPTIEIAGIAASGKSSKSRVLPLSDISICGEKGEELIIPSTVHALVHGFAQQHMDKLHPIDGMIGMEVLELYDVDFDFPNGRLRLWTPGTAARVAKKDGLVQIPAAELNESLLRGIRVTDARAVSSKDQTVTKQPFVGVLDCGATFTTINWYAAQLLGLPPKTDKLAYGLAPVTGVMGVGVDGKPMVMPTKNVQFTFVGDAEKLEEDGSIAQFRVPPVEWTPWKTVSVGIGDLPVFQELLGEDEKTPFQGPAAILGMDILSQRRVIMETCTGSMHCSNKRRRLFVSPK